MRRNLYEELIAELRARQAFKDKEARSHHLAAEDAEDESQRIGAAIAALEEQAEFNRSARDLFE